MAIRENGYKFVEEPADSLKCCICLEVARKPLQHEVCGKLFCRECIARCQNKPCPVCRTEDPKYFIDKRGSRDIRELEVRCDNSEHGCPWEGTVESINVHLSSCQYALVPCPNHCKDDKDDGEIQVMRKHLEEHLQTSCSRRLIVCQHCGQKGTFTSVTGDHDKICEKKKIACPNKGKGCKFVINRGEINDHLGVCQFADVACAYESLGCEVRMLRKDIIKHQDNDDKHHLHLMLKAGSIREEQHRTLSDGEALVFKVTGYASKKDKREVFYSLPFYTHPGGYKMCIGVKPDGMDDSKGTHVSVFAELLKGRYDRQLQWPFLGAVTYEVLNQLSDDQHHSGVSVFNATVNLSVGGKSGYTKFLPHSSLCHDPATNTQYLLDDTLYFRVSVKVDNHKPWLICTDKINTDLHKIVKHNRISDTFVFKITHFRLRKETDTVFHSDPFYTSLTGYKLCIKVLFNGVPGADSKYLSVFVKLLDGAYGEELSVTFTGSVAISLLNQVSDDNHCTHVVQCSGLRINKVKGYSEFISLSELGYNPDKNTQYLKNDVLYFKVSVAVVGYRPWLECTHHN